MKNKKRNRKFKKGDLIVIEGLQNPARKTIYKVIGLGTSKNLPEGKEFPIYRVQVVNSKNGHSNVLEKSSKWVDCAYRKANQTEEILYGKEFEIKDQVKEPGKDLLND